MAVTNTSSLQESFKQLKGKQTSKHLTFYRVLCFLSANSLKLQQQTKGNNPKCSDKRNAFYFSEVILSVVWF